MKRRHVLGLLLLPGCGARSGLEEWPGPSVVMGDDGTPCAVERVQVLTMNPRPEAFRGLGRFTLVVRTLDGCESAQAPAARGRSCGVQ